ncbi:MAG: hypothetical protein EZS28_021163, partial [Streblomastix strix]
MHFVLLLAVSAVLCVDFIPPLPTRSAEQGSAFKANDSISLATNALYSPSIFTSLKPTNDACKRNVSKTATGDDSKQKVQDVLDLSPCDGYEITLVDSEHYESVQINKPETSHVLIKGGAKDEEQTEIHTIWGVNSNEPRTVTLLQGDLTIQNIEFIYFESTDEKQDEQDEVIWPWNAIIYAYDTQYSFRKLSLESCIFKGLGSDKSVNKMIYSYDMNKLSIVDQFIVENSTFENINFTNYGRGALYVDIYGQGYQTGGIYGYFYNGGTFDFSNNKFSNNSKLYSGNGGNDAYLMWYNYPLGWTIDNTKYKVQQIFEDSKPSNENNVYYELRTNNEFEFSGYITSGTVEQDPGEDLEPGTEGCIWNVNQTGDVTTVKKTIMGVLAGECDNLEGYKVTLLNDIHYESVTINKPETLPVLIKGGAKDEEENNIHTIWGVNTSAARTITLLQGNLTIQNIEFIYKIDSQSEQIQPWNAIIYSYDPNFSNGKLSLESCIFKGLGSDQPVNKMIYVSQINKLSIVDCIFQDANINDSNSIYYHSYYYDSEFIVQNSTFVNIRVRDYGRGIIRISVYGQNQIVTLNGSTFENCSQGQGTVNIEPQYQSSSNQKQYIITNNKFINNIGYETGGIYGRFYYGGTFDFSNNKFSNNSIYYSRNGGNDAYLMWYNYPLGWNIDNAKYKVYQIFEDSKPSNENNVYYEFRANDEFEFSGYITSGTVEQDPGEDLEPGTEGCIRNVNQTGDGIIAKKTIMGVLAGVCDNLEGYKVTLLNAIHYESVTINKTETFPVLIKGGAKDEKQTEIHTVWGVNTSAARTITLLQGNLTISNIEFIYKIESQSEQIQPWNAIIFAYDPYYSFRILSLESCIFKGLGSDQPVNKMIYVSEMIELNITQCTFQDANINDSNSIYYHSNYDNSEFIVENSTFENINFTNYGRGIIRISVCGSNQTVTLNGSTFENCSQGEGTLNIDPYYISSSNQIQYIITNNKFINNIGYQTGGIYGRFYYGGTFDFSSNEFTRNRNRQENRLGNDTYLQWYEYPKDWTIYNYRNRVIEMFDKCNSTSDKSVYAEFRVNYDFDVSRYIYMHDIIQEEFPPPENSQQVEEIQEDEVQQNKIKDIVDTQNNSYIVVPVDEVYEEKTIEVTDDQLFVLQPDKTPNEDNKPVIQPSSEQEQDNPLMIISGNGKVQIDGFIIAHSNDEGQNPLLETKGDAVLRLIGVTLSPNKRTKDGNGTHINPTGQSKSSPFLFAAGKQVVIINVTMEPTSFSGCSGIILDGENENTNHSLILETSTFQVPNNKNGFQSILDASNFTISIFDSIFSGFFETQPQNTIEEESCEWSTSAIHLKDGEINFGNTTFTGLGDGALFVGAGAKVTISESSLLYGNKPSGMSDRMTNFQRNIVCDGQEDNKAQLQAESESFIEKEKKEEEDEEEQEEEENQLNDIKWILINPKTCELSGSIASASNLMFTQQIDGIDTS